MQAIALAIKELAYDNGVLVRDGESEADLVSRVCKSLTDEFSIKDLNVVEDVLSGLCLHDIRVLAADSGDQVADLYERLQLDVDTQMLIEEVLNFAFDDL